MGKKGKTGYLIVWAWFVLGLTSCQKAIEYPKGIKGEIVVVDGTLKLTQDTVGKQYNIADNSVLDCDGHTLRASYEGGRTKYAVGLYGNNSRIINCVIDGYITGISVDSRIPQKEQYRLGKLPKEEALVYIEELHKRVKTHKTIKNNLFKNIVKTPIFVQMFARDTIISNNIFDSAGTMAIYLDAYSSGAVISGNVINASGYNHISGREGIAIDASWNNKIFDNTFSANNIAAITLYKNCGERGIPRYYGADYNVISGNQFVDESKGVWIASRADRNRFPDCIDEPIYGNIARDVARFNWIENNSYKYTRVAVDIRDDDNTIINNLLRTSVIQEGSATRTAVGDPVVSNIIENNVTTVADTASEEGVFSE